jgi:gliding motility-associated-like protein
MNKFLCCFFIFHSICLLGQTSTFDKDADGWRVEGDAQNLSTLPVWNATGGNPNGFAFAKDDAVGGVWYWAAPPKYLGQKCNAYGKKLKFDLFSNLLDKQFDEKDVILASPGLILYYDTKYNPNTTWTTYEIKLDETDDWRVNNIAGPKPTKAQFKQVLENVTAFKIRGEYRVGADEGGLDNVVMEGDVLFSLDKNGSSRPKNFGDYNADTLCSSSQKISLPLCDLDLSLDVNDLQNGIFIKTKTKSISYQIVENQIISGVFFQKIDEDTYFLKYQSGADSTTFKNALQALRVEFSVVNPIEKIELAVSIKTPTCDFTRIAHFYTLQKSDKIVVRDTFLCEGAPRIDLNQLLENPLLAPLGRWLPNTKLLGFFDPKQDKFGVYTFKTNPIGGCPSDSGKATIKEIKMPTNFLGNDLVVCADSSVVLDMSRLNFEQYEWSDGSKNPIFTANKAGKITLKGSIKQCTTTDELQVTVLNCTRCKLYAPNVITANDDGFNDFFRLYSNCENEFENYNLQIFDRWGGKVFDGKQLDEGWDGTFRGQLLNKGVYTFWLQAIVPFKNEKITVTQKGDFLLLTE